MPWPFQILNLTNREKTEYTIKINFHEQACVTLVAQTTSHPFWSDFIFPLHNMRPQADRKMPQPLSNQSNNFRDQPYKPKHSLYFTHEIPLQKMVPSLSTDLLPQKESLKKLWILLTAHRWKCGTLKGERYYRQVINVQECSEVILSS